MSHAAFFRQSIWLMIASFAMGLFMFAVHPFSKVIPTSEYGILGTMLAILNCMAIPALPLQMIFAHQTAAAHTEEEHRRLTGMVRFMWLGTFVIWLLMAGVVAFWQESILLQLKVTNPAALWVTVLVGLGCLWFPMFAGLLQGAQNFLWLGWSVIFNGAGRFVSVAVIVLVLGGYAAGILTGAFLGIACALAVCLWQSRHIWRGRSAAFDWRGLVFKVVPLALGFGACQFVFTTDPIFVQVFFDKEQTGPYVAVGTLSRALVMFTAPLAAVMFPKIVRSAIHKEKTNLLTITMLATGILVSGAALFLSLIAPWLIQAVFKKSFVEAAPLLPWFAWSMVPMAMANVLVNNLLARSQFRVVPWLVLVAIGYGVTMTLNLQHSHESFMPVIRILGLFNVLILAVAAFFTWRERNSTQAVAE